MTFANVLVDLIIAVALPLNWLVTILLWRVSRADPDIRVLRERAIAALAVSIIVTIFALVFLNNDMTVPWLSFEDTKLVTRSVMLVLSTLPALVWLRLYLRSR